MLKLLYMSSSAILNTNFPVTMAPMVGLSHIGLRLLVKSYMPEGAKTFWPTEMLSSFKLPAEDMDQLFETRKEDNEFDIVPQILGNDESYIKKTVEKLEDWGACGVDINMGCPVKKALRHNYGVALMGDPVYAAKVVEMTVRNTKLPVSVKLRAGQQKDPLFLKNFVEGLVGAGASWITIHPRTGEQKRRGKADWSQIRFLKENFKIPIIGNGDVQICDDVFRMKEETSCDMIMVGRALTLRPWLMWQVGEKLGFKNPPGKSGRAPQDGFEEGEEFYKASLKMIEIMRQHCPEHFGVRRIKFFINNAQVWLEYGHTLYSWTIKAKTYDELEEGLARFFKAPQKVYQKTELRY